MTEQMLRQYSQLVEFLGLALGPDYEIVLHEILPENSRVAAIANGSISGRSVGAPITNAALRMIMQKQYETSNYNINYTGRLASGKTIRSSTMFIKDGGKLVGLIRCVGDGEHIVLVQDLIVDRAWRRQGVGSQLFRAVWEKYRTVRMFQVVTDIEDEADNRFYRSFGMKPLADGNMISYFR